MILWLIEIYTCEIFLCHLCKFQKVYNEACRNETKRIESKVLTSRNFFCVVVILLRRLVYSLKTSFLFFMNLWTWALKYYYWLSLYSNPFKTLIKVTVRKTATSFINLKKKSSTHPVYSSHPRLSRLESIPSSGLISKTNVFLNSVYTI